MILLRGKAARVNAIHWPLTAERALGKMRAVALEPAA